MAPIRVLNIITRLEQGGAPLALLETVRRISPRFQVDIAVGQTDDPAQDLLNTPLVKGLRIIQVPHMRRNIHPFRDLGALWQLIRIIRAGRYDIVHTHTSKAGLLGRVAAYLCGVTAVVHSPHGTVLEGYFGTFTTRFFALLERLCAHISRRIICLTPLEIEQYRAVRIGQKAQYTHVFNGIDIDAYEARTGNPDALRRALSISPQDIVATIVGRLVPVKGHTNLLHAFQIASQTHPNLLLLITGDGELRSELEQLAQHLGITDRVRFLGWRDDTAEILEISDLFVLSSLNEGLGLVLVEAMAKHLPIVATRVGGVPCVVEHGKTGLLVPSGSPQAFARALGELADQPQKQRAMGEAGYRRAVRLFSISATVRETERVYHELTGGPA